MPSWAHTNTVWWQYSSFLGPEVLSSQNIDWPVRIEELHNHLKTVKKPFKMARNKVKLTKGRFSRCDLLLVEDSISLPVKGRVTILRFYKVRKTQLDNKPL